MASSVSFSFPELLHVWTNTLILVFQEFRSANKADHSRPFLVNRLLKRGFSIIRNRGVSVHQSTEPQRSGFWDQKGSSLPSLTSLSGEVEAELASTRAQRSSVAIVHGHSGSGAMSVALEACNRLLGSGFWAQAVYVGVRVGPRCPALSRDPT